jgi:cation diffusion facilitator CzcD-associated flavoprotein CzcO
MRSRPGRDLAYFESVARRHGVDELIRYGLEIRLLEYIGSAWRMRTFAGEREKADVVIAATGCCTTRATPTETGSTGSRAGRSQARRGRRSVSPQRPRVFPSSRWDHSVPLAGARLGVVGTASSAVQIVGAVTDTVAELRLFQCTPHGSCWCRIRQIDEAERARYRANPSLPSKRPAELNAGFVQSFANAVVDAESPALMQLQQAACANLEDKMWPIPCCGRICGRPPGRL